MPSPRLEYLFDRFVNDTYTKKEEEELMSLVNQPENQADLQILIDRLIERTASDVQMPEYAAASVLKNILQTDKGEIVALKSKRKSLVAWMRVAAAAAVIIFAGATFWILAREDKKADLAYVTKKALPILPGGDHAILTMGDGNTIVLDGIQNEKFQNGTANIHKQGGMLIFNAAQSDNAGSVITYNTLSTPRGGEYQVVLPDGSKVWLNASSSLYFPSAFPGSFRDVVLTGEAYFEVAKNKDKPFRVKAGGMEINVLGTHFNVNAYEDEMEIKTSLLEGSVKITKGDKSNLLKPGQQGVINKKEGKIGIREADLSQVVAWKNGLFQFDGADITTIMREIGRWYDVDIVYAGKVPKRLFAGKIRREAQLTEVLKILELSNVQFTVEGKKIIVE